MSSATSISKPRTPSSIVLDTDVASYVFKWHPQLAEPYLELTHGARLIISFATSGEMLQGALEARWGSRRMASLRSFLSLFLTLHTSDELCLLWASIRSESLRKGRRMDAADAWIAASARFLDVPLVTNNTKHYRHLDGIEILSVS